MQVSAVSAVVNWGTSPKPFIFRNYNHSPGRLSRYSGGSGYQLWQAVRASSAAPGYFQEFPLYNDIHQVRLVKQACWNTVLYTVSALLSFLSSVFSSALGWRYHSEQSQCPCCP